MVRGCGPHGIGCGRDCGLHGIGCGQDCGIDCGIDCGREDESTGGSQSTTKILMIKC